MDPLEPKAGEETIEEAPQPSEVAPDTEPGATEDLPAAEAHESVEAPRESAEPTAAAELTESADTDDAPEAPAASEETLEESADAQTVEVPAATEEQADETVAAAVAGDSASGAQVHRRWWRRPKIWAAIVVGLLTLGAAGASYATYGFTHQYRGKILPGATVAGTEIGGMTDAQAMKAVRRAVRPQLHREITVTWGDRTWHVTPKELGARSNARAVVNEALAASAHASFAKRMEMRVLGSGLGFDRPIAFRYPRSGTATFVHGLATTFDQEAQDATIDYSNNWVKIVHEKTGRTIKMGQAITRFRNALRTNGDHVSLPVETVKPKVTTDAFKTVLLLHIGENKLYLYQNGKITHTYTVATGQSIYPTPQGIFHVIAKVEDPMWINPAPDGWGKDMPPSIPPGPDNPLGLRAIYWSAPGIRFHGIPSSELSSLGHNASHGCVRMSNEDVMQLYPLVDIGTTIVSVQTAPYS